MGPVLGVAVVAGLGRDDERPLGPEHVEESLDHRDLAPNDPADGGQGGVDEQRVASSNAQPTEVQGKSLSRAWLGRGRDPGGLGGGLSVVRHGFRVVIGGSS